MSITGTGCESRGVGLTDAGKFDLGVESGLLNALAGDTLLGVGTATRSAILILLGAGEMERDIELSISSRGRFAFGDIRRCWNELGDT